MRGNRAAPADDEVRALVEELLRTGHMFSDVLSGLLDDMPDDAFPGESPAEVLIEMLTGSVRPAAEAAGAETVRAALALVGAMATGRCRTFGVHSKSPVRVDASIASTYGEGDDSG